MSRKISFAILAAASALAAFSSTIPSPAAAEFIQDRYCLQGRDYGFPGNCQFSSYAQCMASASGTPNSCGINPRHAFADQYERRRYMDRY